MVIGDISVFNSDLSVPSAMSNNTLDAPTDFTIKSHLDNLHHSKSVGPSEDAFQKNGLQMVLNLLLLVVTLSNN